MVERSAEFFLYESVLFCDAVRKRHEAMRAHLLAHSSDGFPSGKRSGRSSGEVSKPTESAALRELGGQTADEVAARLRTYDKLMDQIVKLMREAVAMTAGELAPPPKTDLEDGGTKRKSGAGICQACQGDVSGVPPDRIVSGYCPKCYRAWKRAVAADPDLDRAAFNRGRRK